MTDYTELVKSLRICASEPSCEGCKNHVADEYYELYNSCTSGAETLMKEAADAIEQLSTYSDFYEELTDRGIKGIRDLLNKFPKWIPVTERLPKDMEKVLIFDDGKVKVGYIFDIWQGEEVHHEWYSEHYPADPSHWMPIPTPPKEEHSPVYESIKRGLEQAISGETREEEIE